jgi:D-alanyl-lipoteichoic acid acyltransferase DltB (MBOAT superfamily)
MCATKYAAKYQNLGIINIPFLYIIVTYFVFVVKFLDLKHTHTQRGRYCLPIDEIYFTFRKHGTAMETKGPLPVSTNHAVITCTK